MPLASRVAAGAQLGLGSDVSGGSELSLFGVMRAAAYAQQAWRALKDDSVVPLGPLDWLRLATLGGAGALRLDKTIGSIEPGKDADLIAVDPAATAPLDGVPDLDAMADPEALGSRLIFRANDAMVRAAWVRGRRLEGPT
jgi:guanine deaminase